MISGRLFRLLAALAAAALWTAEASAQAAPDRAALLEELRELDRLSEADPAEALKRLDAVTDEIDDEFREDGLRHEAAAVEVLALSRLERFDAAAERARAAVAEPSFERVDPTIRARMHYAAGLALTFNDEAGAAFDHFLAARDIWEELGSPLGLASTYEGTARLRFVAGDQAGAVSDYQAAWALIADDPPEWRHLVVLNNLAAALKALGRTEEARDAVDEALSVARSLGNIRGVSASRILLAELLVDQGELEEAGRLARAGLAEARGAGLGMGEVRALQTLAEVERGGGDLAVALELAHEALVLAERAGAPPLARDSHRQLADLAEAQGDHAQALLHLRAFQSLSDEIYSTHERR